MALALFFLFFFASVGSAATGNWQDAGNVAAGFAGGDGSQTNPYRIATAGQLAYLAQQVNEGAGFSNGKYFKLTADIDLSAHNWTPIGKEALAVTDPSLDLGLIPRPDYAFIGTFDGDGYMVSGLAYSGGTELCVGLFGCVGEAALKRGDVANLNVAVDIRMGDKPAGGSYAVGGIAGMSVSGSSIRNCTVAGAVVGGTVPGNNSNVYIGGVVGWGNGITIIDCAVAGNSNCDDARAIVGATMTGNNASTSVGGIAGYNSAGGTISNCASAVEIRGGSSLGTSGYSRAGGIAGVNNARVLNCANAGTIAGGGTGTNGFSQTGGIAGSCSGIGTISDCANTGAVAGGNTNNGFPYTGGIVGWILGEEVSNCYSYAGLTAGSGASVTAGGVVGSSLLDSVAGCYWNKDAAPGIANGIGDKGGTPSDDGAAGLGTGDFAVASHFTGWDLSGTGTPDGHAWFYPAWDPGRPRPAVFFGSDGSPRARIAPLKLSFDANGAKTVNLIFVGDWISYLVTGYVPPQGLDGLTFVPGCNMLVVTYMNGTRSGTEEAGLRYAASGDLTLTASFDITVVPTYVPPPGPSPEPPPPSPCAGSQHICGALRALDAELKNPSVSVRNVPRPTLEEIAKRLGLSAVTVLRTVPAGAFRPISPAALNDPKYTALSGSFGVSIDLTKCPAVNGNAIALTVDEALPAKTGELFEGWANMTDARRLAKLSEENVRFIYEFSGGTSSLIPGVASWAEALAAGAVSFTPAGVAFGCVVVNASGDSFLSGNVMAIPDGDGRDGKLLDPLWLVKAKSAAMLEVAPRSMDIPVGGTNDVTVKGGDVVWTVADGTIAKIEPAGTPGLYRVTGLAVGTTTMTAALVADPSETAAVTVTVGEKARKTCHGSCDTGTGLMGAFSAVVGAVAVATRKKRR